MRKIPNYFNKSQLVKLFDCIQEADLMMAVFISVFCGLRISETVNLCKDDFDFEKRFLKIVNSKNPNRTKEGYGKDRVVAIPSHLISPLKVWFGILGERKCLFPSISSDKSICREYLEKKYFSVLVKAGLREIERYDKIGRPIYKYNFHTLRHTYATILWEKTGDIYAVKSALGHSRIRTTEIYTHVNNNVLRDKIDSAFSNSYNGFDIKTNVQQTHHDINPVQVLKFRLAKGEINLQDYQKTLGVLGDEKKFSYIG